MGLMRGLRKMGVVRFGAAAGRWTDAAGMPDEILMEDVYDARYETVSAPEGAGGNLEQRSQAMFCQFCGSPVAAGANFCAKCGKPAPMHPGSGPAAGIGPLTEPKKRMAIWKKVLLGGAAAVVLIVALSLYLTGDLLVPVNNQLSALRGGDIPAAYRETSLSFQKATPLEDFARFIQAYPGLASNKEASFTERRIENEMGYLRGTLTDRDGGVLPIEYQLVRENQQWKILGIQIPTAAG